MERLVELAALQKTHAGHRLNLVVQDDRLGRVALRLVERGGILETIVRAQHARTGRALSEGLPYLIESLAARGVEASPAGESPAGGWQQEAQRQDARSRQQRRPRQNSGRARRRGPVFRVETGV